MSFSKETFIEGEHYFNLGLTELAKEKFTQALEHNKSHNDEQGVGVCLFYLTQIAYLDKNVNEALKYLQEAKALYHRRNHDQMLNQLDILEQGIHDLADTQKSKTSDNITQSEIPADETAVSIESEIEQIRKEGKSPILAEKLLPLAQEKLAAGDYSTATSLLHEAHEIAHLHGDQNLQSKIHKTFDDITLLKNHQDIDERSLQDLVSSAKSPEDKVKLALGKAEILILHNDLSGANEALHEARKLIPSESKERFIVLSMIVEFKLLRKQNLVEQADKLRDYAEQLAGKINDDELISLVQQLNSI